MPQSLRFQRRRRMPAAVVVGLVVLSGGAAGCGASGGIGAPSPAEHSSPGVEESFYATLANAAHQQRIRVAMYRETFATDADATARKDAGTISSSVSEVNTETGQFRSVFATNILRDDGFSLGRCHDKTTYVDDYSVSKARPQTVAQAASRLKISPQGDLYRVGNNFTFTSCPHVGLMPGAANIAMSRLSDGLMPVTLTEPQAQNWARQLRAAELFTVTDEGTVDRDGVALHKYSFAPKNNDYAVNRKLFTIFHTTGEIERLQREYPNAELAYEFLSINPINSGGVGGFYLFDDARHLPVYSELYGTNPDKPKGQDPKAAPGRAAFHNIARTKQTYAYPTAMTVELDTPLEFLN
jgi:hypothetical protein